MADKEETKEIQNPRQNNKTNRQKREEDEKKAAALTKWGRILSVVVVALLVVGIIVGIATNSKRKAVAKVGNETITEEEFKEAVSMQRSNINNNFTYMEQLYAMFGMQMDESTKQSYEYQMSDAYKPILGQTVLSNLIDQRILKYGAAQEGIEVSDAEVEAYYEGLFGYYPEGTPTAGPTSEPFEATPTVSEEQLAILRYTATPEPTEVPTEEPAVDVEAAVDAALEEAETAVESAAAAAAEAALEAGADEAEAIEAAETAAEVAEEIVAETAAEAVADAVLDAAEEAEKAAVDQAVSDTADLLEEALAEPTATTIPPTPTAYTEAMFKSYESVYFANNFYYSKEFFKDQIRYELLRDKVEEKLEAEIERSTEMVWARHILVETEEEAKAALDRINAGEEWADVAAEVSLDGTAATGGDLGWFTRDRMVPEFSDAAFSQEVGTISDPVKTDFGYHLIQVIAHEEHPFTSSEFDNAVALAYQSWLDSYADQLEVTYIQEDLSKITPSEPAFVGNK